ncbi:hypothetical protein FIBSPDRAFT_765221, partial [Athelia psychrophila]
WDRAASVGAAAQKYAEHVLDDASVTYTPAASGMADIKLSMSHLIERTKIMEASIVEQYGKSLDDLYELLAVEMGKLAQEIREEFPPPDHAQNHAERQRLIAKTLRKAKGGFIRAFITAGIPKDEARSHWKAMESYIRYILVTAGDLIEQHPVIAGVLLATVAYLVPKSRFLRPIFDLFGFGLSGPVKGSFAARAQSRFFGAYIPLGSWFSKLQAASMRWR